MVCVSRCHLVAHLADDLGLVRVAREVLREQLERAGEARRAGS